MFQTLKARRGNSGNSEYVLEYAHPPFNKQGAKKHPACTQCKLKKLRCILEADSCLKCQKQGLECSFRSTSVTEVNSDPTSSTVTSGSESQVLTLKNNHGKRADSLTESTQSVPGHGEPTFSDRFSFPDLLDCDNCFDFSGFSNDGVDMNYPDTCIIVDNRGESHCAQDEAIFPQIQVSGLAHDLLNCHGSGSHSHEPEEQTSDTRTRAESSQITTTFIADSGSWDRNLIQGPRVLPAAQSSEITLQVESSFAESARAEPREPRSLQALPIACCCLDQIMGANETLQIKLVWGITSRNGHTISIDDMLQCQKDILCSCETFLKCSRCSLRSDYIMLIVSMLHQMMNSIGYLDELTLPGSQHKSLKRSCLETSGGRVNNFKRGLKPGGWRLDDEDEMQVIRRLIDIRIKRLESLTGQLEKVVSTGHSAYEWIVCALKEVINEKTVVLGSKRDDDMSSVNR